MRRTLIALAALALGAGCAAPDPVTVTPVIGRYGLPAFDVDGERFELSIDERRQVIQGIVTAYCPAE